MNLLLTNDDGIDAPGLAALAAALSGKHTVTVVAPQTEMSGVGHAFTLHSPLMVKEKSFGNNIKGYAVSGTPSDCVKMAVTKLLPRLPDLLISGINNGENTGISSFYSGTVAGAREGLFFGLKSLSASLCRFDAPSLEFATAWMGKLLAKIAGGELEFDGTRTFLNINFPNCAPDKIAGSLFTRQGITPFADTYEERKNPAGVKYFWLLGDKHTLNDPRADDHAVERDFITVTPLTVDMTDHQFLERHQNNGTPIL